MSRYFCLAKSPSHEKLFSAFWQACVDDLTKKKLSKWMNFACRREKTQTKGTGQTLRWISIAANINRNEIKIQMNILRVSVGRSRHCLSFRWQYHENDETNEEKSWTKSFSLFRIHSLFTLFHPIVDFFFLFLLTDFFVLLFHLLICRFVWFDLFSLSFGEQESLYNTCALQRNSS